MKGFIPLAAAVTVAGASAASSSSNSTTSYLSWLADSFISRGVTVDYDYTRATFYLGIEAAYALTGNTSYLTWYQSQMDGVVSSDGSIVDWNSTFYSLDEYRMANQYLYWYNRTNDTKYKTAATTVHDQLVNRHPRNTAGGFWHRSPTYPNQMWLDGIFMADSFYARWTQLFDADNTTAWDDVLLQYALIEEHCRNATSGLLVHGYDQSKVASWADPVTGASPLVWDRAVGWYFLSLLESWARFPSSHEGKEKLSGWFTTLAAALKKAQDDESGGWWLVMSEPYPGMDGNYIESSATAMFTAGMLQGIRLGLLDSDEYLPVATRAYNLILDRFVVENADGTLNWEGTVSVGSLKSNATFEYYTSVALATNDLKGAGPFLLAAYEWESWASSA